MHRMLPTCQILINMSTCRYLLGKQLRELQKNITYQQFTHHVRKFSKHFPKQCLSKQNTPSMESLLESWYYEVDTFGLLKLKIPFNVQVKSLNPQTHPKMNRVIVQVMNTSEDWAGENKVPMSSLYDLKTQVNEMGTEIEVTATLPDGVTLPIECVVQAPIKMNIHIDSEKGNVALTDFENDVISVNLLKGNCILNNMKSGNVNIVINNGSIVSRQVLHANVDLQVKGKGDIKGQRFQGISVECKTNEGDITLQDVYAETGNMQTISGSVDIGSCHGNTTVSVGRGNLKIASVDGNLNASINEGQTDVYIARHDDISITCNKGDITLKYADSTESRLELLANDVSCDQQIRDTLQERQLEKGINYTGFINKDCDKMIKASAFQGKISFTVQDWLASIGLKQFAGKDVE